MADNLPDRTPHAGRALAALALARLAHVLTRFILAAALLAIPAGLAVLLWHMLAG